MSELVVMGSVDLLLARTSKEERHPGLVLDKFSMAREWDAKDVQFKVSQGKQKTAIQLICASGSDVGLLANLHKQRDEVFTGGRAVTWTATTAGPLTLHLSRANALENAGIALHPLYGFAYLPGSGLKGAARAYAETIWLQAQPETEHEAHNQQIARVFGCAPGSDKGKEWLPQSRQDAEASQTGAVVFHDAWPKAWPTLFVDIAAIHHPKYYQAPDSCVPPPGDWETPSLISFLAITPSTTFCFAISPRSTGPRPDAALLGLAQNWLNGALATLGIGAKTAAGYGLFQLKDLVPVALPPTRTEALFNLTLVTPAFLAGSAQEKEDCDLRGATLRGQLRWWWRTMHAAHLEPRLLRRLEAAVWGARSEGSAVRISIESVDASQAVQYPVDNDRKFLSENKIATPERGRIHGLSYLSYGMAERADGARWYRQPGDRWTLRFAARRSEFRSTPDAKKAKVIPPQMVLAQATASLWLLSRYGGVGSKARKGFGSLADVVVEGLRGITAVKDLASEFRGHCDLPAAMARLGSVPALEGLHLEEVETAWSNPWHAIDAVGRGYQDAVKGTDPRLKSAKEMLGMPRKGVRGRHERLASSLHLHVAASRSGLAARITTFDLSEVNPHAAQLMTFVRDTMKVRLSSAASSSRSGQTDLYPPRKPRPGQRSAPPTPPTAQHPGGGRREPIQPASPPLRIGQMGYDADTGESIVIVAIKADQMNVRFVDDGAEEWIGIAKFRPMNRR